MDVYLCIKTIQSHSDICHLFIDTHICNISIQTDAYKGYFTTQLLYDFRPYIISIQTNISTEKLSKSSNRHVQVSYDQS